MTHTRKFFRACMMLGVAGGLVRVAACGDDATTTMPPLKGGKREHHYSCLIGPAQNSMGTAFQNARVNGTFTQGLQSRPNGFGCPYIVDINEPMSIGVQMTEPWSTISNDYRVDFLGLFSKWTTANVAIANSQYWANDPNNADGAMVEFAETYNAGVLYVTNPPMDFAYDSGLVEMTTIWGRAQGRIVVTGGITSHTASDASSLVVPSLTSLSSSTIRAIPQVDTNSYGWD